MNYPSVNEKRKKNTPWEWIPGIYNITNNSSAVHLSLVWLSPCQSEREIQLFIMFYERWQATVFLKCSWEKKSCVAREQCVRIRVHEVRVTQRPLWGPVQTICGRDDTPHRHRSFSKKTMITWCRSQLFNYRWQDGKQFIDTDCWLNSLINSKYPLAGHILEVGKRIWRHWWFCPQKTCRRGIFSW